MNVLDKPTNMYDADNTECLLSYKQRFKDGMHGKGTSAK